MMKPVLLAAVALLVGLAAAPATAEAASYTRGALNMRTAPTVHSPRIRVIPAGRAVSVRSCTSRRGWCLVGYRGTTGWVSAAYLTSGRYVTRRTYRRPATRYVYRYRRPGISIYVNRRPYAYPYRRYIRPRGGIYLYYRF